MVPGGNESRDSGASAGFIGEQAQAGGDTSGTLLGHTGLGGDKRGRPGPRWQRPSVLWCLERDTE